jgi:glycosyltransferase involved in cell wall biosynthesis
VWTCFGGSGGKALKVVYLNPTGILGGAEMCLLDLLAVVRAARPGWSLRVLLGDDGPLRAAVEGLGVACALMPLPARLAELGDAGLGLGAGRGRLALTARGPGAAVSASSYLARLRRRLRAERPDLVQTNGMKAHLLGAWAAPRGVPVVWHLHDYLGARAVMARLLRWSARARREVRGVAVSHSVADDARRVLGARVPVEPIYNAIDLARFAPGPGDPSWLDAQASMAPPPAPGTVRLGLVATYARWKGHDVFLEAVARVATNLPARFYIIGGPLYRSSGSQLDPTALRARADALGLSERLGFIGHQPDPEAVYRALDVVVHASTKPEPFGRVIVEAMACGRAVIVARGGGAAELFEDGVSALGCPPGDPKALAGVMTRLIANPDLRRDLGAGGRAEAIARFDRGQRAEEWMRIYEPAVRFTEQGRINEPNSSKAGRHQRSR